MENEMGREREVLVKPQTLRRLSMGTNKKCSHCHDSRVDLHGHTGAAFRFKFTSSGWPPVLWPA